MALAQVRLRPPPLAQERRRFLDNIAAAMIGGSMAGVLYRKKVHIGFLAAIVAASNAGGAGSVVGDTTTTMMWIAGVSPLQVVEAYAGAFAATWYGTSPTPPATPRRRRAPSCKGPASR